MSLPFHGQIRLNNVGQSFYLQQQQISLFQNVSLSIKQGQSYAITGPSGSGKSSLLMLMSGLERPTSGSVHYSNKTQQIPVHQLREDIGFIFQQFHLLPELDALNNVALPLRLRGLKNAESKAQEWLEKVGLGHRLKHKSTQLSGGEQQRVAIARALVFEPKFIFADEPTGNLDAHSAQEVTDILFSCSQAHGAGLVIVTHSEALARQAQHSLVFSDGQCRWSSTLSEEVSDAN
ncbi:ABC transporter ATP-binding protein [Alteromonas facilis]|uniref:ABC transporter ATP-binding protein n=1 Tax=Alteromonas facilis TaxID=2048004 RepID=UPI000C290454|nr:ABC transporter ATP-binding protein [Alteromonas facilis]